MISLHYYLLQIKSKMRKYRAFPSRGEEVRLKPQWWLAGALRQTGVPVLVVVVLLIAAGYLMQSYAPEAASIGAVWRHWRGLR